MIAPVTNILQQHGSKLTRHKYSSVALGWGWNSLSQIFFSSMGGWNSPVKIILQHHGEFATQLSQIFSSNMGWGGTHLSQIFFSNMRVKLELTCHKYSSAAWKVGTHLSRKFFSSMGVSTHLSQIFFSSVGWKPPVKNVLQQPGFELTSHEYSLGSRRRSQPQPWRISEIPKRPSCKIQTLLFSGSSLVWIRCVLFTSRIRSNL